MVSYLIGGKCLQGVEYYSANTSVQSSSSFSFSSSSSSASSSLSDSFITSNQILYKQTQNHTVLLRRLGLSTEDLTSRLLQVDQVETWLELDASRNQITVIPTDLQLFTGLTQLVLSNNAISFIPSEVYHHLSQLQTLILSENQIEIIPEDMPYYLPELVTLSLDSNLITSLPDSIGSWKNLREFRLGSAYGGNLIQVLPDTISDMINLVDLDVSFNQLHTILPHTFLNLLNLKYLNLSHNQLDELPQHDILFGSCGKLTTIDLSDNLISTIPEIMATDIMRLILQRLELLNLSDNQLCILPTELLDQPNTQVIIKGNSITHSSFQQQQQQGDDDNVYNQIVRGMIQTAAPTSDYPSIVRSNNNVNGNNDEYHLSANTQHHHHQDVSEVLTEQARQHHIIRDNSTHAELTGIAPLSSQINTASSAAAEEQEADNENILTADMDETEEDAPFLLHSLREIAFRGIVVLSSSSSTVLSLIPDHIAYDLKDNKIQKCPLCQQPYVREWISSVQLKSYRGHPSVVRKIRFCGSRCWQGYRERLAQQALAAQSNINNPTQQQQDAVEYIQQHENAMEPGSIEWIMAAVSAASAQEEQADILANVAAF